MDQLQIKCLFFRLVKEMNNKTKIFVAVDQTFVRVHNREQIQN